MILIVNANDSGDITSTLLFQIIINTTTWCDVLYSKNRKKIIKNDGIKIVNKVK